MPMSALETTVRDDLGAAPLPDWAACLCDAIRQRHPDAVVAVLFYGSCRRRGTPEGIADFLVLVHSYRAAHSGMLMRCVNAVLPPNVYYLEAVVQGATVRCKYGLLSIEAFERRCRRGRDGYFWARFSQPAQLAYAKSDAVTERLVQTRVAALRRFASAFAPLCRGELRAETFWADALRAIYRCELRPEPAAAADSLVAADAEYYRRAAQALLPEASWVVPMANGSYDFRPSPGQRGVAGLDWLLRRIWGRTLNVARLLKAAGTFTDGLDYVLWKLERHSGVRIEPTPMMRRFPRLAAFRLAWIVWRKGALRA